MNGNMEVDNLKSQPNIKEKTWFTTIKSALVFRLQLTIWVSII